MCALLIILYFGNHVNHISILLLSIASSVISRDPYLANCFLLLHCLFWATELLLHPPPHHPTTPVNHDSLNPFLTTAFCFAKSSVAQTASYYFQRTKWFSILCWILHGQILSVPRDVSVTPHPQVFAFQLSRWTFEQAVTINMPRTIIKVQTKWFTEFDSHPHIG